VGVVLRWAGSRGGCGVEVGGVSKQLWAGPHRKPPITTAWKISMNLWFRNLKDWSKSTTHR